MLRIPSDPVPVVDERASPDATAAVEPVLPELRSTLTAVPENVRV
jgi:hypothetical protein